MKRIVLKVGSAVLTENNFIAIQRMRNLVDFIAELSKENEVILVSSGAVSAGYSLLQLDRNIVENKQALASLGQPLLMHSYKKKFDVHNIHCAQILVTSQNFKTEEQSSKIKKTIDSLLSSNIVVIVNENDTTSTDELVLGDNDQLSAYTAYATNADMLVILSDIDAYYSHDPRTNPDAKVLKVVNEIPESELCKDVTPNNCFATGGIVTKLKSADYLLKNSQSMFLASGFDLSDVKSFLLEGKHLGGTLFTKDEK
ncbi:MAG: glutamate 5-kinase [Helicobacteraceae bacterium]|nr:glutamate 5-kinase [Helicobacteraceae bacterium]